MATKQQKTGYGAKSIQVLEGLDPVRKRPGMYIGGTSLEGLHHLVWEVVNNSIDEAMAGHCDRVVVRLLPGSRVEITDNGRGIPVEKHPQTKKSTLETVMTILHAGGKFGGGGYKMSGGLHGVGVSVVNALSVWTRAEVRRGGKVWVQEYKRGKSTGAVKSVGNTKDTGTTISFEADPEIFPEIEYSWKKILDYLRWQAYLTKGVHILVEDSRKEKKEDSVSPAVQGTRRYAFYFDAGIISFVDFINRGSEVKHAHPIYIEKQVEDMRVELALQYSEGYKEHLYAFANNIHNPEGGMHVTGFKAALTRVFNDYAKKHSLIKDKEGSFTSDDLKEGLTAIVSVKLPDPQFEGQTKAKLGNTQARSAVSAVVTAGLSEYLEAHPADAKAILQKCLLTVRARIAARAAKDAVLRKGALEGMTLPGKLADCTTRKAELSELYIVEGDSAGGCFSGDTEVALADGRSISFEDMVREQSEGKKHFVYTIRKDKTIGLERALNARVTKKNAEVIRFALDNGEKITCTPDHRFMLRDGRYKQAKDLNAQDSLMPLHKKGSNTRDSGITIHRIVKIEVLSKKMDVYDIEVPGTHNFALASGVFVHNSAKQGRDRQYQAILPLRGKLVNVEKTSLEKVVKSDTLKPIIIALGVGIGESLDIGKLRYHKIIIMADADVDGSHIRTLLLTFFYRYYEDLIRGGYVYIAQPPLYGIRKGKKVDYVYTESEKDVVLKKYGVAQDQNVEGNDGEEKTELSGGMSIQRYKGLGEMNPELLWETTMNPESRVMYRVSIEDAEAADKMFDVLMGRDVEPRRRFIQTHAKYVQNLDI